MFAAALIALVLPFALTLPLRWVDPPGTAFMWRFEREHPQAVLHHRWVAWESISPWMALAVVAAEDQKFPHHAGFDFASIAEAVEQRERGLRGASTISQQLAKNLYLSPSRSWLRKAAEAVLTVALELSLPKRRILEIYLNVAEFAPGVYGVGAASARLLGVDPAMLGPRDASRLAAVLPSPSRLSAAQPSAYLRERIEWIETQMRLLGGPDYLAEL